MEQVSERVDDIGFGDLRLIQNRNGFCYGVDAVLLADFAKIKKGGTAIDLGTGNGIVPIIMSHKTEAARLIGVEIQEQACSLANRSVALNDLEERITIYNRDVKDLEEVLPPESADTVTSNPPYMERSAGLKNQWEEKLIARHETTASLEDFIKAAARLLKNGGSFYMVHRPSRLIDIAVMCRKYRLEPKELRFISPKEGDKPNIMLIHCRKNGGSQINVLAPLYVYNTDGSYSCEIMKIYERI